MPNQIRKKDKQAANNKINKLAGTITVPLKLKGANIDWAIREAGKDTLKKEEKAFSVFHYLIQIILEFFAPGGVF